MIEHRWIQTSPIAVLLSGTSLVVYVGTMSQLKKQTALGGMAVRLIRDLSGTSGLLSRESCGCRGQHMAIGFENAAP